MEKWLSELPMLVGPVVIGVVTAAFAIAKSLKSSQFSNELKKSNDDKALLKHLLEGFGLEIPPELKELDENAINSIKTR